MSTLMIRNVDPQLKERLRIRAARHGRSMEAELRQILGSVLAAEETQAVDLAEAIRRRFALFGGLDLDPLPPMPVRDPPTFDG